MIWNEPKLGERNKRFIRYKLMDFRWSFRRRISRFSSAFSSILINTSFSKEIHLAYNWGCYSKTCLLNKIYQRSISSFLVIDLPNFMQKLMYASYIIQRKDPRDVPISCHKSSHNNQARKLLADGFIRLDVNKHSANCALISVELHINCM